jgi:hypothetical protein
VPDRRDRGEVELSVHEDQNSLPIWMQLDATTGNRRSRRFHQGLLSNESTIRFVVRRDPQKV